MRITFSTKPLYDRNEVEKMLAVVDTAYAFKELILTGELNPRFEGRRYYPTRDGDLGSIPRRSFDEFVISCANSFLWHMRDYTDPYRERKAFGTEHCCDFDRVKRIIGELEKVVEVKEKEIDKRKNGTK